VALKGGYLTTEISRGVSQMFKMMASFSLNIIPEHVRAAERQNVPLIAQLYFLIKN